MAVEHNITLQFKNMEDSIQDVFFCNLQLLGCKGDAVEQKYKVTFSR